MATPQSTTSFQAGAAIEAKRHEQITFRFCSECSNMLYPKEDEDAHRLQFVCRTCQYSEPAQSSCIYRNELNTSAGETAGVTQDVGSDPTVSQVPPVICLCCGSVILCSICGSPCSDLCCADSVGDAMESMGLGLSTLDWGEEDLFGDEEPDMNNPEEDSTKDDSSRRNSDISLDTIDDHRQDAY